MRHHQEQELEALRNTFLNAGLPNAPEADIQRMFLMPAANADNIGSDRY